MLSGDFPMNYTELWEILKTGKQVEIEIDKSQHRRIMRAFRNESHKDRGFRLYCAECGKHYRFVSISFRTMLIVKLKFSADGRLPKKFLQSYR